MSVTDLQQLHPIPTLLARVRAELADAFAPDRPMRVSRAPGRLDVMGGIADYTGSLVCEMPLDRAAAVALQERTDREVQVFSFNLLDEHKPFTLRIPLDALANRSADELRREFAAPGRTWAGYMVGCLFLLHERGLVDLRDPARRGINLALLSTVPSGAGVSSSAAIEVATMMNLADHFGVRGRLDPMSLAEMCQSVENRIVGAPCGIMDQVTACAGESGRLLRLICQPHEMLASLAIPAGIRVLGIDSRVKHSVGGAQYARTRCAAFMGHKMILEKMRAMGRAANRVLDRDPMNRYLANLDPNDYKKYFRPYLPNDLKGGEFLLTYGPTEDIATKVHPDEFYSVQHAVDHHVLEARRVINFARFLEEAAAATDPGRRGFALDKAGHLMYASHLSYSQDAMLGAPECDVLVDLVRKHEPAGLYGAKITGGGSGGTVAVLADATEKADAAIAEIVGEYHRRSGLKPEAISGSSDGAWMTGTMLF